MQFAYIDQGQNIRLAVPVPSNALDHLPARVYSIQMDDSGVFLQTITNRFTLPENIYGTLALENATLLASSYDPNGSTGAIFTGAAGSGKSLSAEIACNKLLDRDIPVIMVNTRLPSKLIRDVVSGVGPCAVVFDEFGKNYPCVAGPVGSQTTFSSDGVETQTAFLTLFSDTSLKGVLFAIIENAEDDISAFIKNRPNRFKYHFRYMFNQSEVTNEIMAKFPIFPKVKEFVRFYCTYYGANVDSIMEVVKAASNVSTIKELLKKLDKLNVPLPMFPTVKIGSVKNNITRLDHAFIYNESWDKQLVIEMSADNHQENVSFEMPASKFWEVVDKDHMLCSGSRYDRLSVICGDFTIYFNILPQMREGREVNGDIDIYGITSMWAWSNPMPGASTPDSGVAALPVNNRPMTPPPAPAWLQPVHDNTKHMREGLEATRVPMKKPRVA